MAAKLAIACRLGLAAIFATAGAMKLPDVPGFAYDIHQFALTPWTLSKPFAYYLPGFEILTAIALFVPGLRLGALFAILGMSTLFSAAIASAWFRGLDLSCGCFGHGQGSTNYPLHLAGTVALFVATGWLLFREHSTWLRRPSEKANAAPR